MPKRVKRRRVHRGTMAGKAQKGNKVTYGEFGLVAMEASLFTIPPCGFIAFGFWCLVITLTPQLQLC